MPIYNMSKTKPSTSMAHIVCNSKLRSVVRSSVQPCPRNWVATHFVKELNVGTVGVFFTKICSLFLVRGKTCNYLTNSKKAL